MRVLRVSLDRGGLAVIIIVVLIIIIIIIIITIVAQPPRGSLEPDAGLSTSLLGRCRLGARSATTFLSRWELAGAG